MNHCTIYRKDTGEIIQHSFFSCADDIEQIARNHYGRLMFFGTEDHDFIDAPSDPAKHYVVTLGEEKVIAERPELVVFVEDDKTTINADGLDETTLTGLPDPCEIIVDDPDPTVQTERIEVTGGGFIFAAETPGVYTIEVIRFPFLPWRVEITAL